MKVGLTLDGRAFEVELIPGESWSAKVNGKPITGFSDLDVKISGENVHVDGVPARLTIDSLQGVAGASGSGGGDGKVKAPMTGRLVKLLVAEGQEVAAGDVVFILEAMKMQNEVKAPMDGVVGDISVAEGEALQGGQAVLQITSSPSA